MKFAYFSTSVRMVQGLMTGFIKNAHSIKLFPMSIVGQYYFTLNINGENVYIPFSEQSVANAYVNKCIEEYKPDFAIVEGYQEQLALAVHLACKKHGIGFIFWNMEDPVGFDRLLPICKLADRVFTTTIECIPKYKENNIDAHLLMFACNPDYHKTGCFNQKYNLDFAVQASWYDFPSRIKGFNTLLKPLLDLNLKYKIWGHFWNDSNNAKTFLNINYDKWSGVLPNTELPDLCASSKIILGFQCDSTSKTQMSIRNFEVLGCKGFYLCQYSKATDNLFVESKHLEMVRSKEESIEKVNFYLKHDDERKKIAKKGQEFVYLNHTYEKRVKEDVLPFL